MNAAHHGEGEYRWQSVDALHEMIEDRARIEQTKGMLMFVYGLDADSAFDMLRRQSQQHNVKLRVIAEQIMNDLIDLAKTTPISQRFASDRVLLSAHQRIEHVASRLMDGQSKIS